MPILSRTHPISVIFAALVLGVVQPSPIHAAQLPRVALVTDQSPGRAVRHGLDALESALESKGVSVTESSRMITERAEILVIAGLTTGDGTAATMIRDRGVEATPKPESLRIQNTNYQEKKTLLITGTDDRGLMYALLDTADRVGWASVAENPLSEVRDTQESPDVAERALSIYTMQRAAFEQRFFDETYWAHYFDMLARNRFNSFVLIFGYENGGYFAPAYPYFFNVEGFPEVRVVDFTTEQQQRYLNALNRLIEMAHDRGLDFTVGLWDHIYRGGVQSGGVRGINPNRPQPGLVWGLSKDNLMAYSTAALKKLLKVVPNLDGVQFRMHGESGLKAGDEMREFWRDIYQVVIQVRPSLRFDARAKEFPNELIELALDMGVNIRICTKYWAEQMGLPFHPTHINRQNQFDRRHGYADLLRYPQRYPIQWRLWTGGTTRILLWGNPEFARRFAESTHLYDGSGFEVNEMLATKMEAQPHDLQPFDLLPPNHRYYQWEFERYWHFYQVFGRIGYNPDTPPETWQREFERRFGPDAAPYLEKALHAASWILPRINASLFPYNRFPTTRGWVAKQRWEDLPGYANCEGSDTQQFLSFTEAAQDRINGTESAKLHPERNSVWLAETSQSVLDLASGSERRVGAHWSREFESTITDLRILANLALYHSRRIHAGLDYALFKQSGDLNLLDNAIRHERHAIDAWDQVVRAAGDAYTDDLMMGLRSASLSGHWKDELAELRRGVSELETHQRTLESETASSLSIFHAPIRTLKPGTDASIRATVTGPASIKSARVVWSLGDETFTRTPMKPGVAGRFAASIPGAWIKPKASYLIEAEDQGGNRVVFPSKGAKEPISLKVTADNDPPLLIHTPIITASPGIPLKISARVRDPNGVKWSRVRYRSVTQFEDFKTIEMKRIDGNDEFETVIPGNQLVEQWDFMYLFEVMDNNGNGKIYPDLEKQTPYVVVKLQR